MTSLAKPTEDPHFVDAKPSHIVTLNRADVLIEGGAELELGWLPPLLENSRNSKISARTKLADGGLQLASLNHAGPVRIVSLKSHLCKEETVKVTQDKNDNRATLQYRHQIPDTAATSALQDKYHTLIKRQERTFQALRASHSSRNSAKPNEPVLARSSMAIITYSPVKRQGTQRNELNFKVAKQQD